MQKSINLFIGENEADLTAAPDILFNFRADSLTNPAAVRNSYSKTVTLPGTPANNRIFGQYWAVDRTASGGFNASKKVPFSLFVDSELYQSGYCRLNAVKQAKNAVSYEISLFGGIGEFLANLEFTDSDAGGGRRKKLSDLKFFAAGISDTELDLGFTINKDTVAEAWEEIDDYSSKWNTINFAPAYEGIPSDFDANKVLMNLSGTTSPRPGVRPGRQIKNAIITAYTETTEDSATTVYRTYGGYALANLTKNYTAAEMREWRSYLMRPVLSVGKTIDAICRPENNGGYTVELDSDFFKQDNIYYSDMFVTLPRLSALSYTGTEAPTDVTAYFGALSAGTSGTTEMQYYEDRLVYLSTSDSGRSFDITLDISLDITGVTGTEENMYISADSSRQSIHYPSGIFVQLVAYDATGRPVAGSDEYYLNTPYGMRHSGHTSYAYFLPRDFFEYQPRYGDGYINQHRAFSRVIGGQYRWDEKIPLTAKNVPAGSTLKLLVTKVCKNGSPKDIFSRQADAGGYASYTRYSFGGFQPIINASKIVFHTPTGLRTGAYFSQQTLLDTEYSPSEFLLSYCKLFGLYIIQDPVRKKVKILSRKNFFKRGELVDIQKYIDRQDFVIKPTVYDAKWYEWNLDADESEYGKTYERVYGKPYGQRLINTDSDFGDDTVSVLDGNIFRGAVQALERSSAFCYSGNDTTSRPWQFPGFSYLLYDSTDVSNTHEVTINASSTIDAFSGLSDYMYYDLFDKVQLHTADNNPADGAGVLLLHGGSRSLSTPAVALSYYITDDNSYMDVLNQERPCWLYTNSETDSNGNDIAIRVYTVPYFSRYRIFEGSGYIYRSLDFGKPEELYLPQAVYTEGATLYEQFWQGYIKDLYSPDTHVITAKMHFPEKPTVDWLRRFYWLDGAIYRMAAINDYDVSKDSLTEVELVKVGDVAAYDMPEITPLGTETLILDRYEIGYSGGTVYGTVYLQAGGTWAAGDTLTGKDAEGNSHTLYGAITPQYGSGAESHFAISLPANTGTSEITWNVVLRDDYDNQLRATITQAYPAPVVEWTSHSVYIGSGTTPQTYSFTYENVTPDRIGIWYTADWFDAEVDATVRTVTVRPQQNPLNTPRSAEIELFIYYQQTINDVMTLTQQPGTSTITVDKDVLEWTYQAAGQTIETLNVNGTDNYTLTIVDNE